MISISELEEFKPERRPRNDIGASTLFNDIYRSSLVYIIESKSYYFFNGKYWEKDIDDLRAHEKAKEFAVSLTNYFSDKDHENEDALKWYSRYFPREKRVKLVNDVKSIEPKNMSMFDKQPVLFNCQNCTVNLATGLSKPHDSMDYITHMSNVWFDPEAKSADFEKFVNEIMEHDDILTEYLQECLGYSLSGATFLECFFVTYGATTRNGKGTLDGTMMHLLGSYAKAANYETFESKKYKSGSGASEDIARLAGARYVSVSEPAYGMVLDGSLIKKLSGNDVITARRLYEGSFDFIASFKIWINTNHLPIVPDETVFSSGRLQLIPFNKHFSEKEQDKGLKARLKRKENISGIFNWCMEGFQKMAIKGHLEQPEIVVSEIFKYQEDNDKIGEFLNECCVPAVDEKKRETLVRVYKAYRWWMNENGYKGILTKKNLKKALVNKGITIKPYGGRECVYGRELTDIVPTHVF